VVFLCTRFSCIGIDKMRQVDGKPHGWSFVRDGDEKDLVECEVDASDGPEYASATLKVGMKDLLGTVSPFILENAPERCDSA